MTDPLSIRIGRETQDALNHLVATGRFANVEEAVLEAVWQLMTPEDKMVLLQAALDEGERSDLIDDFDPDEFLRRMNALNDEENDTMAAIGAR